MTYRDYYDEFRSRHQHTYNETYLILGAIKPSIDYTFLANNRHLLQYQWLKAEVNAPYHKWEEEE